MPKYHHGDLRGTLIAVATELLAEEGIHTLSLRKIAQKAGVSHNAPYMHFPDREAVLAAIAEEGFRLLIESVKAAIDGLGSSSSTRQKLIVASTAYISFTINHPNHVQVMFYPYDLAKYPSLLESSRASLNQLFELVEVGQKNGELTSGSTLEITKVVWAMIHGVATLSTAYKTNILSPESPLTEEAISTFINYLLDGLAVGST